MTTTSPPNSDPNQYRLPTNVKPTHYDVTIRTDLEKHVFLGFVKINLDVKEETSTIVLNTAKLDFGRVTLVSLDTNEEHVVSEQSFIEETERVSFSLLKPLPAGTKAELRIPFSAELTGSLMGYYKSSWEHQGKTKFYALTQFEPTAARRAFPCWDEPLLKSTFAITLISRASTTNLSNMPAISEKLLEADGSKPEGVADLTKLYEDDAADKWKVTRFETTPPMSTYIVAIANGEFEYLEKSVTSPLSGKVIPLRIYATADVIHQAQFALDVKAKVLPLYEKVFDVEFPLPKLDTLVASDFDAGAMENWGLITGRTSVFLLDPDSADLQAKKTVASVQSHEVAHMWFGNITTMEWWNYLYLNEGFATLMGEVIIAAFPEWRVDSEFIGDHLNSALSLDAKLSSHPIEVDCPDANHINQIFDALSYSKAASVLRMLSNYVGEERFLKGVSIYLKRHLYGNSVTKDLWRGIGDATGLDIIELMDNWISKMGFPVITVSEKDGSIVVRQDRFLASGIAEPKDNETIWNVPLNIVTVGSDGKQIVDRTPLLTEREKSIALDTSKPFKLNASTTGVYRVLYSPERSAKIAAEAAKENSVFTLNDRIGLVHDAFSLSKAGLAKLSSALTLVDLLKAEKEYLVWSGVHSNLTGLNSTWWEHPEITAKLNAFRRSLFVPIVKKLGYENAPNDSSDTTLLRTTAVSASFAAEDEGVIKELRSRFDHYLKTGDDSKIPPDLQRVVFQAAVKYGGRAEYDAVVGIHDKPKTPTSKIAAILAMTSSPDPALIKETFEFTLKKARTQDVMYFIRGFTSTNPERRRDMAEFFKSHYEEFVKIYEGNFAFSRAVQYVFEGFSTEKDRQEVVEFFKDKDTSKFNLVLAQTLDGIQDKTTYIERSTEDLKSWLLKSKL